MGFEPSSAYVFDFRIQVVLVSDSKVLALELVVAAHGAPTVVRDSASRWKRTGPACAGGPWGPMQKDSRGRVLLCLHVSTLRMGEAREHCKLSLRERDTKVMCGEGESLQAGRRSGFSRRGQLCGRKYVPGGKVGKPASSPAPIPGESARKRGDPRIGVRDSVFRRQAKGRRWADEEPQRLCRRSLRKRVLSKCPATSGRRPPGRPRPGCDGGW